MRGEGGGDPSPGAGRADSPAAFREEDDRLVLANPFLSLAFGAVDGTVLSLLHRPPQTELIEDASAAAEGFLWRLEIASADGDAIQVTNQDAAVFAHDVGRHRHDGTVRLWLEWRDFRAGAAEVVGRVTASISLPADQPSAEFEAEIGLPDHLSVRSFAFPCLCAVGSPDLPAGESVFLPLSGGILAGEPRASLAAEGTDSWQVSYPGPAGLQMFGYCCTARTTAWLASRDISGARKVMRVAGMPRAGRLILSITHYPTRQPDGHWSAGYPTAVGLTVGDWYEAARQYRSWAVRQTWCAGGRGGERRLPSLTSAHGLWTSYWGGARGVAATIHELHRLVNLPIKLDWRCWHGCARDGEYPDYFPARDGDEVLAATKRQLDDAGVLAQLSLSGLFASAGSQAWAEDEAHRYAIKASPDGNGGSGATGARAGLTAMCPSTQYWRGKLAALAAEMTGRGADGIYVEDIAASEAMRCLEEAHHHDASEHTGWTEAVRAALRGVRTAIGGGRHLAADGPGESLLDIVDAFVTDHPAAERAGAIGHELGPHCSPIPLFSAVYHDYATLVGPGVSLVNQRPHDAFWPADAIAGLRDPSQVLNADYQAQFCLEVGRAAAWGLQPVLENFAPGQARDDVNRRKLAFLAAAARATAWGVGALLPFSEFMGPLAVDSPPLSINLLVNPLHSSAAERRAVKRAVRPVLGSAWRSPGGSLALVLVNIHDRAQDFTARLRSQRLHLQLPLRLVGRVFSEDGDVPAPTLRASGSEIGGRLSARSILLVSLH